IEGEDPARLDERSALLAHHHEAAGDALRAARWHRRAADWSEFRSLASSTAHWRAVRTLAAQAGDSPEAVALRLPAAVGLLRAADYDMVPDDEIAPIFAEGRELALRSGDDAERVRLLLA